MFLMDRFVILLIISLLACKQVAGHEFWIAPDYPLLASGQLQAQLKIGSDFDGSNRIYNPRQFQRFEFSDGESWQPVPGRMGIAQRCVCRCQHPAGRCWPISLNRNG